MQNSLALSMLDDRTLVRQESPAQPDARLLQMMLRVSPLSSLSNITMGLLTVWVARTNAEPVSGLIWPAGLIVIALLSGVDSLIQRHRPLAELNRPAIRHRLTMHVVLTGLMYSGIAAEIFPQVDRDRQFLIGMMICGVIPVGAVMMASVRAISVTWTLVNCIGVALALYRQHALMNDVTIGLLLVMCVAVVASVILIEAGLRARLNAEATALQDRQALNVLLDDFESQAHEWTWESDAAGRLQRVSPRMATALGATDTESLLGQTLMRVLGLDRHGAQPLDRLSARLGEKATFRGVEVRSPTLAPGGTAGCWSISGVPVHDESGHLCGWRGLIRDVSLLRAQERELHRLAHADSLTGLANRHLFEQRSAQAVDRLVRMAGTSGCGEGDPPLTLYLLDLDNFKAVNDSFGHVVGDRLLQEVAHRLTQRVAEHLPAETALLARLGGDEFALLVEQTLSLAQREAIAHALLDTLRTPWLSDAMRIEVRASLGVASWKTASSAGLLLQKADGALYEAKAAGRDTMRVFDADMRRRQMQRTALIRDLGQLLAQATDQDHAATPDSAGRLAVHYQPQYDLTGNQLIGVEALLRWQHPERGWIAPAEFIPVAEETGLIVPLGIWVLQRACRDALNWPATVRLAVNLSAVQLGSRDLVASIRAVLADTGLPPHRLELEVTETALLAEAAQARISLRALQALGVQIALDDFGTGYSSLACLAALPVDTLKIDRSFVAALSGDSQAESIVRLIIQFGQTLGMKTLAEGVETASQREVLQACGCTQAQGYLFSVALDAEAMTALIAA